MNGWDIVIICLIGLLLIRAVLVMERKKKNGGCGSCAGCSRKCDSCYR